MDETQLQPKTAPFPQKNLADVRADPAPRPSLRRTGSRAKKSVRFAPQRDEDTDDNHAEDFVFVSHHDSASASSSTENPQEDESTRPVLATICCLLAPSSEMNPAEKSLVWWQAPDYEVFKGTARLISSEIRRRTVAAGGEGLNGQNPEGYAQILTRSLDSCRLSPLTSSPEAMANPLPRRLFAYLTHWVRVGHSRRGLERWSIASHATCRNLAREDAIKAVIHEQDRLKRGLESPLGSGSAAVKDTIAEGIKRASERCTRPARLFALAIGQADAAAVGCDFVEPPVTTGKEGSEVCDSPKSVIHKKRAAGIGTAEAVTSPSTAAERLC